MSMTYEEEYDAVHAFCDKYESEICNANEGSDLFIFKGLDDAMMDIESVLCDDGEMLLPSNAESLNDAKSKIIDTMLHIAERWSNETDIDIKAAEMEPDLTIVWTFDCPLCKHRWTSKNPEDYDVGEVVMPKTYDFKVFQARMRCTCCGLLVYSWTKKVPKGE